MTPAPAHSVAPAVLLAVCVAAVAVYLGATRRARPWPVWRSVSWAAGASVVGVAPVVAQSVGGHGLASHMATHLLLGMLAPLLLVWSAPVTLALRALPTPAARVLVRALRSGPARLISHPVTAAVLDVGGLWVLYRTGLYAVVAHDPELGVLVHVHMVVAGFLFTAAIAGPDPAPHRAAPAVRAAVLVLAVAAHDVLAKTLVAAPPDGVPPAQAELAGPLMYYGALPVHVALAVLLCRDWFGRPDAPPRHGHRPAAVGRPAGPQA